MEDSCLFTLSTVTPACPLGNIISLMKTKRKLSMLNTLSPLPKSFPLLNNPLTYSKIPNPPLLAIFKRPQPPFKKGVSDPVVCPHRVIPKPSHLMFMCGNIISHYFYLA